MPLPGSKRCTQLFLFLLTIFLKPAYVRRQLFLKRFYVIEFSNGDGLPSVAGVTTRHHAPVFSPDGAFLADLAASGFNGYGLAVYETATGKRLQLIKETFPALKGLQSQLAGTMSGGQQQMLAIARALMSSPRLLLIDEPSVGLSPLLVSQTIAKIGELNQHLGLTVLMAEQNFNQAIRIADRGYIIVHGEIVVAAGSVDELRGNDIVKRLYLGGIA